MIVSLSWNDELPRGEFRVVYLIFAVGKVKSG